MAIVHSRELAAALDAVDRIDITRVKIMDKDGTLKAVLRPVGGRVPADKKQAQLRSFEIEFRAEDGLTPEDLKSILAPGWHMLVEYGTKLVNIAVHELYCHTPDSWVGELLSCTVDTNGALTLGD